MKQFSNIKEVIVHTGQHFDANMSDIFFEEMEIPKPDYNLDVNGLNHGAMTGQMLEKIEAIILKEKPDWVLVYGDTNSTLAGALAAAKLHVKVAHVEAGLRSFNMAMPEEINRILTDRISAILFAPTDQAVENLKNEGFEKFPIHIVRTGDVMLDAAIFYQKGEGRKEKDEKSSFGGGCTAVAVSGQAESVGVERLGRSLSRTEVSREARRCSLYSKFKIQNSKILTTLHRAENTDTPEKLHSIFSALEKIAEKYGMILPLHPRTKKKLEDMQYDFEKSHIHFIEPVGYLEMIALLSNCSLVMTDSGGLQKEAYFFKKPCVTLREETEWVELVNAGCNTLVGSDTNKIINAVEKMILLPESNFNQNLYGDGNAGKEIVETLLHYN
ncbi:MAG: UDP-N-acetyl glucosamine 2-epimerase [Bacteroidetes bacterium]|nr:UDP-N-acetyl glucosamine 2-epimerase [Bacteroidota bacterium]